MRLDKFLVACAVGSRTEVKNLLKAGRVMVNGKKEKSAKLQIDEGRDEICFDGQVLEYEEFVYYMMNKPQGVISATEDPKHRTVLDLLDDIARSKEVFSNKGCKNSTNDWCKDENPNLLKSCATYQYSRSQATSWVY